MTVLESANLKLFSLRRKHALSLARNKTSDTELLDTKIKYWSAFIDGVKAQRYEDENGSDNDTSDSEEAIRGVEDE